LGDQGGVDYIGQAIIVVGRAYTADLRAGAVSRTGAQLEPVCKPGKARVKDLAIRGLLES
jgi:hypothetical protein